MESKSPRLEPRGVATSIPSKLEGLETATRADHNPLFTKFWQELRAGKGVEKGEAEVEEMVNVYTDVEPLSSLSEEETIKIKEHLRRFFRMRIEGYNRIYNTLINDEILLVDGFALGDMEKYSLINVSDLIQDEKYKKIIESYMAKGARILTSEQKVKLFSDPEFFKQALYHTWNPKFSHGSREGFGQGSRRLTHMEGGYYRSNEEFKKELEDIRQRTGKLMLRVLDVGSNFGFALKDMKNLDSNIETFNMTVDEHPSLFGDHIVRHPAEMMPKEFEETMDLIDSQVAFRYFLYSDIALRNVVKSLSIGGAARISYEIGDTINAFPPPRTRIKLDELEVRDRQKALWSGFKVLESQGYLDVVESSHQIQEGIENPDDKLRRGFIRFIKNKSTKGIRF